MVATRRSVARLEAASAPVSDTLNPEDPSSLSKLKSCRQSDNSTASSSSSSSSSSSTMLISAHDKIDVVNATSPAPSAATVEPQIVSSQPTQDAERSTLWSDYPHHERNQAPSTSNPDRLRLPSTSSASCNGDSPSRTTQPSCNPTTTTFSPSITVHGTPPAIEPRTHLASPHAPNGGPSVLQPSSTPENALGIELHTAIPHAKAGYESYMPRIRLSGRPRRDALPVTKAPESDTMQVDKVENIQASPATVRLVRQVRKHKMRPKLTPKEVVSDNDESEEDCPQGTQEENAESEEVEAEIKLAPEAPEADYDPKLETSSGKAKTRRQRGPRGPRKPKPKSANGGPPRPPNAWILYRSAQIQALKADPDAMKRPQSEISKLIGTMWQGETLAVKQVYMEQARLKQEEHSLMYPDYCYQPNRKNGSSPPKRKPNSRPSNPRRSTAPAPRSDSNLMCDSRHKRATSSESLFSTLRFSHCTSSSASSSVFDFNTGAVTPTTPQTPYVYHHDLDYTSDLVLDQSVEALLASLNHTALTSTAPVDMPLSAPAAFNFENSWNEFSPTTTMSAEPCYEPIFVNDCSTMVPWSAPADLTNFNFNHVPSVFGDGSLDAFPAGEAAAFTPSPMAPSLSSSASSEVTTYSVSRHLDFSHLSPGNINVGMNLCEQEPASFAAYPTSSLASPINMLEPSLASGSPAGEFTRLGCSPLARVHSLSYGPGPEPSAWTVAQQEQQGQSHQQQQQQYDTSYGGHFESQTLGQYWGTQPQSIEGWIENNQLPFDVDFQVHDSYTM